MDTVIDLHRQLGITALAVMAAACALMVVCWPYLMREDLAKRMRAISVERERIRVRERRRLDAQDPMSKLRRRPGKLLSSIVGLFGVGEDASNAKTARMLQHAGYRGNAAMVTYLAARIIAPVAATAISALYVFMISQLQQPLAMKLLIVIGAGGLGLYLPAIYVKNQISKRQLSIQRAWPDALDLMLISVESGMGIETAMQKVSEEIGMQSIPLAEELALTTAELSFLPDRWQAYDNLAERTGLESVKAVIAGLKQAEKHGTSLGRSLRVLVQENRANRLSLAEKKAAALPPKLTVPMILFFLPVLFAVIITPAAIQISSL